MLMLCKLRYVLLSLVRAT